MNPLQSPTQPSSIPPEPSSLQTVRRVDLARDSRNHYICPDCDGTLFQPLTNGSENYQCRGCEARFEPLNPDS